MTHHRTTALTLGCLLAFCAAEAAAQTPIRMGQTIRGALTTSDLRADDDSYLDLYTFTGRRGERLVITLKSSDFDTFLAFGRMQGGEFEAMEADDDGGGGTDSRLRVTLDADGTYLLRANSLGGGETGAYEIALAQGSALTPAARVPIGMGQTVTGALATSDARLEGDDTFYDLYRFTGRAGQRVEVVMTSTAFDAYLALGRMENGELQVEESDDDGAGESNARIRATLDESGEYVIRANSLNEGETGAYTLSLRELPPRPAAPAPAAIRAGQTVQGTLSESDAVAEDESYYDAYTFTGRAGDRVTVTMRSDAFDAFLALGRMVGGQFEQLETNDDGGDDGTNARISFTLPEAGTYVIRANSLSAESTGAYTLTVQSSR